MNNEVELKEQLRVASLRERGLWEQVKGKYPGQPGHDEEAWKAWLDAANEVRDLARRLRESPR